jgi:hypothetical protein
MIDYQVMHTIKFSKGQPDLEALVRLFLSALPCRSGKFLSLRKYFGLYFAADQEAVLGSNLRNMEIRLYFLQSKEIPGHVFLILVLYNLNWKGSLQSLYLRPFLLFALWAVLRLMKIRHS